MLISNYLRHIIIVFTFISGCELIEDGNGNSKKLEESHQEYITDSNFKECDTSDTSYDCNGDTEDTE